jgi:hypothetical protein
VRRCGGAGAEVRRCGGMRWSKGYLFAFPVMGCEGVSILMQIK